jgi:superkiller protein 3
MNANAMQTAQELISKGRWEDAYKLLSGQLTSDQNDPLVEHQLGLIAYNIGDYEKAQAHLRSYLNLVPDNGEAHYELGLSLLKTGKLKESVPSFQAACNYKANFTVAHLHLGIALLSSGQLSEALAQFVTATNQKPSLNAGHYQAGLTCLMLGSFGEALSFFEKALSIDPSFVEALIGLGQSQSALAKFDDAVKAFSSACRLEPDDVNLSKLLAVSLINAGRYDEAVRQYQELINLGAHVTAKERSMAYNDWGVCLYRQGRIEEASEKLVQAVDVDYGVQEARVNLGLLQLRLNEYELAHQTFEKLLAEQPENRQYKLYLAMSVLFAGGGEEALQVMLSLRDAPAGSPKVNDLELWIGFTALSLGNIDLAGKSFEKALQVDPRNYLALDGLGSCYAATNQHEKALERFGACLSINRNYALGHMHAARSLEAAGEAEAAKQEYAIALQNDRAVLLPQKDALDILLQASQFNAVMSKSVKLLEIAPDDLDAKLILAKALRAENYQNESLELLGRILNEHPDNSVANNLAGQILMNQGRLVEADDMFRKSSANKTEEPDASLFYSWGKTLALLGLHELAIEKYQIASEIDPYDGDVYEALGATLKLLGRFAEAAEVYKRAADYI